ncbi:MAG: DUF2934 domain-containing protein [Chlorobiaceae bacterium]
MAKRLKNEELSAPEYFEAATSQEQQEEEIRFIAYCLWKAKGRSNDSHVDDWLEAEELVNS